MRLKDPGHGELNPCVTSSLHGQFKNRNRRLEGHSYECVKFPLLLVEGSYVELQVEDLEGSSPGSMLDSPAYQ